MKKAGVILVLMLVLCASLVFAENPPGVGDSPVSQSDADKIQGAIGSIPITGEGKFDEEKFKPWKSKAEERIDAINQWIEDNASWLKLIFGMVPEISWKFALALFILLDMVVVLILNGSYDFSFLESFLTDKGTRLLGIGLFVLLWVIRAHVWIADRIIYMWKIWWVFLIIIVVLVIILFVQQMYTQHMKKKKEDIEKEEEAANRKALGKFVKGATQS